MTDKEPHAEAGNLESWDRYFDEKEKHWYYFNAQTGESKWEEESADNPQSSDTQQPWNGIANPIDGYDAEFEDGNSEEEDEGLEQSVDHYFAAQHRHPLPATAQEEGIIREAEGRNQVNEHRRVTFSDEAESVQYEGDDASKLMPPKRWQIRYELVKQDTAAALRCWNYCFFFHACACEAPCAVVEGSLRGCALLLCATVLACVTFLVYLAEPKHARNSVSVGEGSAVPISRHRNEELLSAYMLGFVRRWWREGVLFLVSAASLVVCPCSACVVYRGYSAEEEDEWNMSPLPTVLGAVDPRRFGTFVFGQGSEAANVDLPEDLTLCHAASPQRSSAIVGSGDNGVLPLSSSSPSSICGTLLGVPRHGCMDTWAGEVLYPPRRLRMMMPRACRAILDSLFMSEDLEDDATNGHQHLPTQESHYEDDTSIFRPSNVDTSSEDESDDANDDQPPISDNSLSFV